VEVAGHAVQEGVDGGQLGREKLTVQELDNHSGRSQAVAASGRRTTRRRRTRHNIAIPAANAILGRVI
jgi:hypothetical protein